MNNFLSISIRNKFVMLKSTTNTINIDITLPSYLRDLLNNQKHIESESQFNCTQVKFAEYEASIMCKTIITKHIFGLLFAQHPVFEKNKNKLYVSTFRTGAITESGLNGEAGFHRDNILFPGNCDRNLIITWCSNTTRCGTEALSIQDTERYLAIKNKYAYEKYHICTGETFDIKLSDEDLLYCNDEILDVQKYVSKRRLTVYKSSSPNAQGNITALIMSGKSVLHRREPVSSETIGKYRYVLNIYYNSNDF